MLNPTLFATALNGKPPENAGGIYMIYCVPTGRLYVGSAVSIRKRWRNHREDLVNHRHHNARLQNAWDKYGQGAFEFRVLHLCSRNKLLELEQEYIDAYSASKRGIGFNIHPRARSALGHVHSADSRKRMSEGRRGKPVSEAQRRQLELLHANNVGTKWKRGRKVPIDFGAKVSAGNRRVGISPERRKRMIEGMLRAESRAKISAFHKGRPLSVAHRAKIAAAISGTTHSEDRRRRQSARQRMFAAEQVERIKLLHQSGLSQGKIAIEMGCSKQTVNNVVRGRNEAYRQ